MGDRNNKRPRRFDPGSRIERVWILHTDEPRPVYHAASHFNGNFQLVTMCGLVRTEGEWWTAHLRRVHADKFAKPCGRCYPSPSFTTGEGSND